MPEAPAVTNTRCVMSVAPVYCWFIDVQSIAVSCGIGRLRFGIRNDPRFIGLHEPLQEFSRSVVDELAVGVEQFVRAADIGFRLRHRGDVQKHQRLPQMMVSAESADTARRGADDRTWLTAPCVLATRPGADIDSVFQDRWHRAVILGRHEKNCVDRADAFTKRRPFRRRFLIAVLIVDRQLPYIDEAEFQSLGCHFHEGLSHLAIDRIFPEAADEHGDVACLVLWSLSFVSKRHVRHRAYPICTDSIEIDPPSTPSTGKRMLSSLCRAART